MSTKLETARRAADHARAEEARAKQVRPGATFDLVEGGTVEGNRLIALGAARLPTAGEIAAYEAAK